MKPENTPNENFRSRLFIVGAIFVIPILIAAVLITVLLQADSLHSEEQVTQERVYQETHVETIEVSGSTVTMSSRHLAGTSMTVESSDDEVLAETDITVIVRPDTENRVVLNNADYTPYLKAMKEGIESHWTPPDVKRDRELTVVFKINEDGSIAELKTIASSGIDKIDRTALEAVKAASPFEPLPASPYSSRFYIKYTFISGEIAAGD